MIIKSKLTSITENNFGHRITKIQKPNTYKHIDITLYDFDGRRNAIFIVLILEINVNHGATIKPWS